MAGGPICYVRSWKVCTAVVSSQSPLSVLIYGESQIAARGRASRDNGVMRWSSLAAPRKSERACIGSLGLAQCDAALKARQAAEIAKGAAGICTVESCIGMTRARTAEEARVAYQAERAERQ